ncbi:hypothetical protein OSB04_016352 [Centaurea solstitialis]|uniref:EamA domain-containing protein n=1 Tax=Centaurea solstitialis TaxID=347529 RepID=A0AA38W8E1_9ASTR|nr:hypothetical protein OSB04_016352 [Centaurea solstitialis]
MVSMETEKSSTTDLNSMKKKKKMQRVKATMMMIAAQLAMAGTTIFYKLAVNDGMHITILITYRYIFASIIIFPLALYLERNKRPKLTWKILIQAFVCAIVGIPLVQITYVESLVLTSATYATAFTNLTPPITFIIGLLFGLEKLEIGTLGGKAKVIGTLVGVTGAMVLTFYKGHQLNIWSTHFNVLNNGGHVAETHHHHHTIGSLLALASSLCVALNLTLQGRMSAVYPCHYSSTFIILSLGSIQSLVISLCVERSWSQWKLGWNIRLLAVFFMGIGSALTILFITTSIHLQGPLFVSNFSPLSLVFVAIVGSLLLDENLHVGSVLGAVIIIIGLYVILWGKSNMMRLSKQMPITSSKDVNDVLSISAPTTALDSVHVAHTSVSTTKEDNELNILSTRAKQNEQEAVHSPLVDPSVVSSCTATYTELLRLLPPTPSSYVSYHQHRALTSLSAYFLELNRCHSLLELTPHFLCINVGHAIFLLVYVHNLILTSNHHETIQRLFASLHKEFAIRDLGRLSYFLGLEMETSKSVKMQGGLKASMMMIAAELTISGITIFYKLAANDGMHITIMVAYRYLFASLIIFPLALIIERYSSLSFSTIYI